jgi:ribosomal protein L40E
MVKFPEAMNRKFKNVFVCRVCKSKRKVDVMKVLSGKVSCRKCGSKKLRAKRKK